MAKKRKAAKRRKPTSYMMVIRVSVPARDVPHLTVSDVFGIDKSGNLRDLEILNAFYDRRGYALKSARYADR